MSQEKVDKYKQEKANRKKTMAKEKRKKRLYVFLGAVIGIAFVVWIGYSVYLEKKAAEDESIAASIWQEYLEQMATATTGTDSATTGSGSETTGTDSETTGTDEAETSSEEDTTGSEE